jgi:hypothetical protein
MEEDHDVQAALCDRTGQSRGDGHDRLMGNLAGMRLWSSAHKVFGWVVMIVKLRILSPPAECGSPLGSSTISGIAISADCCGRVTR